MERRRLATILSHLSVNTNLNSVQRTSRALESNGDGSATVPGALDSRLCSADDRTGIKASGNCVCCRENNAGSSKHVVSAAKPDAEGCTASECNVKGSSDCRESEFNVKGSCDAVKEGTVLSQMTRGRDIAEVDKNHCVFCDIVRGRAPALKLYEDETCICILDINPLSHGHSLIIPKAHYSSLEVTPPAVAAAMCSIVPILGSAIMKATCSDSFNLLVNSGAAAGQEIFHTHFHIIPRNMNDKLWRSENARRRPLCLSQETALLADCIRENLSAIHT